MHLMYFMDVYEFFVLQLLPCMFNKFRNIWCWNVGIRISFNFEETMGNRGQRPRREGIERLALKYMFP